MAWFNTKNKESKEEKKKASNKAEFRILIWTKVAGSRRLIRKFDAGRFVDEDKVPFIYNEELKFMELYPQDVKKSTKKYNLAAIQKDIKDTEETLEKIRDKKIEDYKEDEPNTKDLEHKLLKLYAKVRYIDYTEEDNAYEYYDEEGRVCIDFLRKGNTMFPLKCDLDTNTIHTASEPVVKKAGILLRNKENKYLPKKLIETSTLILLAIVIVGTLANIFLGGWLYTKYDDSNLAASERISLDVANQCSQIVVSNARAVDTIANRLIDVIDNKTTTQIQGVQP